MTFIEIVLVAIWLGVVIFWPSVKKTGNPTSKPSMVLATAIIVAVLILIF